MSTLASALDRATARRTRASALLARPLPAWAALFANVLAFSGLPTVVPIPGIGRPAGHPGCARSRLPARATGQSGRGGQTILVPGAADDARHRCPDGQHPQRVRAGVDLPRLSPHRLHAGPVVAHAMVGEARPRPSARSYDLPAHRPRLRCLSAPFSLQALHSPTRVACRARCGPYRRHRWPTTRPSCSGALWCCGSVERYAVEPPCGRFSARELPLWAHTRERPSSP